MARGYPDFEGQKAQLWSVAAWAAKEGNAWRSSVASTGRDWSEEAEVLKDVSAGKIVYIVWVAGYLRAVDAVDFDTFLYFDIAVAGYLGGGYYDIMKWGGIGGCAAILDPPLQVTDDKQVALWIRNWSNVRCFAYAVAKGYEI